MNSPIERMWTSVAIAKWTCASEILEAHGAEAEQWLSAQVGFGITKHDAEVLTDHVRTLRQEAETGHR